MSDIIFDLEKRGGSDHGEYFNTTGEEYIYLASMHDTAIQEHWVMEELLLWTIINTIVHEDIHMGIDECLEGDPDKVDDHMVYKYMRLW